MAKALRSALEQRQAYSDNLSRAGSADNLRWLRGRHGRGWRFQKLDVRSSRAVARLVAQAFAAPLVESAYSRLVIDCNRDLSDHDLIVAAIRLQLEDEPELIAIATAVLARRPSQPSAIPAIREHRPDHVPTLGQHRRDVEGLGQEPMAVARPTG